MCVHVGFCQNSLVYLVHVYISLCIYVRKLYDLQVVYVILNIYTFWQYVLMSMYM